MKFVSTTPNTCKLKLHIPLDLVNQTLLNLTNNYEVAGCFYCNEDDTIRTIDTNKGDKDSVYTPNNVINYHTHPVSCYRDAKTSFGSPSGEDYRETVKFALSGNKAHIVFTVEGLYIIQLNPCKIKKLKELTDRQRGILIFFIEEYFKTTHELRCVGELNSLAKRNILLDPYSFAYFASTFDIGNLMVNEGAEYKQPITESIKRVGHTGIHSEEKDNVTRYSGMKDHIFCKIPNMGFPEVENTYFTTSTLDNQEFDLENLRYITSKGEEKMPGKETKKSMKEELKKIITFFDNNPCEDTWNNKQNTWFFVNFFPSNYCIDRKYHNGQKYITPENVPVQLLHEPFIRIFSNTKDGCTVHEISKKNNFKTGSKQLSFGNDSLTQIKRDIKIIERIRH